MRQTVSQKWYSTTPGVRTYVFEVAIKNGAHASDQFTVIAGETGDDWDVKYFSGSEDITSAIDAGTYSSPSVSADDTVVIRVQVEIAEDAPTDDMTRTITP
jgi:hypothetical protein